MKKIKILQISDIHRMTLPDALDDYKRMRDEFLEDITSYCEHRKCRFDHLLICGDIAQSGTKEQYEKAKEYVTEICNCIKLKKSEVYVVPGNHDKLRDEGKPALRNLIQSGLANELSNDDMFHELMQKEYPIFRSLFTPFKNYAEFCNTFDNNEMMMCKCIASEKDSINPDKDIAYWHSQLSEDLDGYCVHLYGFNTSLNCDKYDWSEWNTLGHKMYLSKFAYNLIKKEHGKHINISMMHHPTDYLANGTVIATELDKLFQLQFYGHVHIPNTTQQQPGGSLKILSGAMQPPKPQDEVERNIYCPVYNIVELSIIQKEKQQDLLHVKLEVNKWNTQNRAFECYEEQSKDFYVKLNPVKSRWEEDKKQMIKLPKDVSQRDIRCAFVTRRDSKQIIESIYEGFYNDKEIAYTNICRFLEKIQNDNMWVELWNKLK